VDGDAGSKRSLRLILGQIVCRYNKIKQDGLMSKEVEKVLKNVMKFAYDELSAAIATFIIRVKPLQIKAAMEKYGLAEARAAAMYLIVGPRCLQRKTKLESNANELWLNIKTLMPCRYEKTGMLKLVNGILHQYIPGLEVSFSRLHACSEITRFQVNSIRHAIDALSKKAAERHVPKTSESVEIPVAELLIIFGQIHQTKSCSG
jgi:hypothetical protein